MSGVVRVELRRDAGAEATRRTDHEDNGTVKIAH